MVMVMLLRKEFSIESAEVASAKELQVPTVKSG